MQRTKQSIKNASFSISCQLIQQLIKVAVRIIFIRVIGQEYLGLNSVFTEILTALQLVELGVGPAIAYSLYKPLAKKDTEKVKALMDLYKKAYRIIGLIVLLIGVSFTPFYGFFINEIPENIEHINIIYLIFVFNTAISYFYSYCRTLLVSDQKKYLDMIIETGVTLFISAIQIVLIYKTHSYMLYLFGSVLGTILTNFIASRVAIKEYPFLKEKNVAKLDNRTLGQIKRNVFAMVLHKFGGIVRDATDNLFVSKYISLAVAGIYSNYSMIIKAITTIVNQVFGAVLSSVGNLHATANRDRQKEIFYQIHYINFWMAIVFTCCFGMLAKSFILIIADESYVLDASIVIIISIRFYLDIMRKTPWMFCEAAGVYWKGKSKPILEALVNIILSLILVKTIGMAGIFIGTIITILTVDLPIEPYITFKYALHGNLKKYYFRYVKDLAIAIVIYGTTYFACSFIPDVGVLEFLIKIVVTLLVSNGMLILFTFRRKEFKYILNLVKKYAKKLF